MLSGFHDVDLGIPLQKQVEDSLRFSPAQIRTRLAYNTPKLAQMRLLCLLFAVCTALATVHASSSIAKSPQATLIDAIQSFLSDVVKLNKLPNDASEHSIWFKCVAVVKTIHCTLDQMPTLAEYEKIVAKATNQGGSSPSDSTLLWAVFVKDGVRSTYGPKKDDSITEPGHPITRAKAEGSPQRMTLSYKVNAGAIEFVQFKFVKR